jgi:hypothetical protein
MPTCGMTGILISVQRCIELSTVALAMHEIIQLLYPANIGGSSVKV